MYSSDMQLVFLEIIDTEMVSDLSGLSTINALISSNVNQVFLVLRVHLGDECLGSAAGVLYEMIEVDCQHSDDPGAGFQRWRHDHMNRHVQIVY